MLGGRRIRVERDDMEGVFVEEVDSGEEAGVLADGCNRRRGLARVGLAVARVLQESTLITLWRFCVVCLRRIRPLSSGTMGRTEVTMCLLLRVTNLKLVCVVRILLKRRVFQVFKPGKKFFKICVFCWLREKGR